MSETVKELASNPFEPKTPDYYQLAEMFADASGALSAMHARTMALGLQLAEATARAEALEAERDHYRQALAVWEGEGCEAGGDGPCGACRKCCARMRTENETLRLRLAAQEKRAEEALARVKHIEWVQRGAPMKGETVKSEVAFNGDPEDMAP